MKKHVKQKLYYRRFTQQKVMAELQSSKIEHERQRLARDLNNECSKISLVRYKQVTDYNRVRFTSFTVTIQTTSMSDLQFVQLYFMPYSSNLNEISASHGRCIRNILSENSCLTGITQFRKNMDRLLGDRSLTCE